MDIRENVYQVIKMVASPLRFFLAVLFILGGIIVGLAWKSSLPTNVTVWFISVTFSLFFTIILLVVILVIFYPKKLVFDQEAHLSVLREQLGDSELSMPYPAGSLPKVQPTDTFEDKEGKT